MSPEPREPLPAGNPGAGVAGGDLGSDPFFQRWAGRQLFPAAPDPGEIGYNFVDTLTGRKTRVLDPVRGRAISRIIALGRGGRIAHDPEADFAAETRRAAASDAATAWRRAEAARFAELRDELAHARDAGDVARAGDLERHIGSMKSARGSRP